MESFSELSYKKAYKYFLIHHNLIKMLKRNKIKMGSNRSFGLVFFLVFFAIALWPLIKGGDFSQIRILPLYFSLPFLFLGLINSKLLTPLNQIWFKFGMILGAIVAPIVMGITFFLVVTPISFIMKILGRDLLRRKYNKSKKSYWLTRDKTIGTMKKQF